MCKKKISPNLYLLPMDQFWLQASSILEASRNWPGRKLFLAEMPHPSLFKLINLANASGWYTAFDQIDDWAAFRRLGQASWYLPQFDDYLAANTDLVLASSPLLAEQLQSRTGRVVHLLPNAYNPQSLDLGQSRQPLERRQVTLGYFGHLTNAWFDWDLLRWLASRHADWIIYLIGAGEEPPFRLPENIRLLGQIAHPKLAAYAANWDAALIPFKLLDLTRAVDPIKVYEYLALGLPVVAAGMPHLQQRMPFVWSVETAQDFEAAILAALGKPAAGENVEAFLAANTWRRRAEQILELLPPNPGTWMKG